MKVLPIYLLTGAAALGVFLAGGANQASASDSLSFFSDNQTYVISGTAANSNYYAKGAMMISANVADPAVGITSARTMDSLFSFNTATNVTGSAGTYAPATGTDPLGMNITSAFNTQYGANNWTISAISVALASNWQAQGVQPNNNAFNQVASGLFTLEVLGTNPGINSGTTWNTLQSFLPTTTATSVGTQQWNAAPAGTNNTSSEPQTSYNLTLNSSLISAVMSGEFTLLGVAADNQVGYVFNTSNRLAPEITITATEDAAPTPIPAAVWLLGSGLMGLVGLKRKKA
jgi:hypothetical protein